MPGFFQTNFPRNYARAQKRYNKFLSLFNSTTSTNNNTETDEMFGRNQKHTMGQMFAKSSLNKNKSKNTSEVTEFDAEQEQESLRILENNKNAKKVQEIVDEAFGIIEAREAYENANNWSTDHKDEKPFRFEKDIPVVRVVKPSLFERVKANLAWFVSSVVSIITSPFRAVWWALSTAVSKIASLLPSKKASNEHTPESIFAEANAVLKAKEAAVEKQNTKGCMSRFTGWGWKAKQEEDAFKQYLTEDGDLDINAIPTAEVDAALKANKNRPIVI